MWMLQYKLPLIVIVAPWKLYSEQTIWGQKTYVWFWGTPYAQVTWYNACAVNFVAFTMEKTLFFVYNIA